MKKVIIPVLVLSVIFSLELNAQPDIPFKHVNISFREYLDLVRSNNLEYAAEKLNLSISEAAIETAKIFPDPYFAIDMTQDYEERTKNGYGFESELIGTIETGGKRRARISLMSSEYELTQALVADYYRNLQADATLVYLEAMKQRQLYNVQNNSYETMNKLYEADSIRLMLGTIMEIDALQSKLEAGIIFNELIQSMAEWKNSLAEISTMTGLINSDTLYVPVSHLHISENKFILEQLIAIAVSNRSDLVAARLNKEVSEKSLILAKKERMFDLNLKLGLAESYLQGTRAPSNTGITAGIEVPLKFSNIYKGDIKMAQARITQAEELKKYAELQIKTEIIKAWELYNGYCKQVENFNNGLLENAENVRKGKIYSYQRGETSLLEVLNAQRTYNEIQTAYYEANFNRASALIELERAAGIWDIDF
jgi:cobalt-zinc-cadmium efflux system outer membrane protein